MLLSSIFAVLIAGRICTCKTPTYSALSLSIISFIVTPCLYYYPLSLLLLLVSVVYLCLCCLSLSLIFNPVSRVVVVFVVSAVVLVTTYSYLRRHFCTRVYSFPSKFFPLAGNQDINLSSGHQATQPSKIASSIPPSTTNQIIRRKRQESLLSRDENSSMPLASQMLIASYPHRDEQPPPPLSSAKNPSVSEFGG